MLHSCSNGLGNDEQSMRRYQHCRKISHSAYRLHALGTAAALCPASSKTFSCVARWQECAK